MTATTIHVDIDKLIAAIGPDDPATILDVCGLDCAHVYNSYGDLVHTCEWHCGAEDRWWTIDARQLNLTDLYAVRWTYTWEAGVDDIEIIERVDDETDTNNLKEWLRAIAANCGSCDGEVR